MNNSAQKSFYFESGRKGGRRYCTETRTPLVALASFWFHRDYDDLGWSQSSRCRSSSGTGSIYRRLPYSIGLLLILGVHELGQFFMARRHAMDVTPPYFFPVPFGLGTFGAFIQMRSSFANRKALFDVAVAGPLAGLVIAVPALTEGSTAYY